MKRSLFAIALDLMLVAALVFVVAPSAKAETGTYTAQADGEIAFADVDGKLLDLNGKDVEIAVPENSTLSVVDSANKGTTGENAGSLKNNGAGSVVAPADFYDGIWFLMVETDTNTYTFNPCYVGIKQIGVNTNKGTLCLQVVYMINEAAQPYIKTGITYGVTPDAMTSAADTFGAFEFDGAVMTAYFDLLGSLADEAAIKATRSFRAYIACNNQKIENDIIEISPEAVLTSLDNIADTFSDAQKTKMVNMITGKAHLEARCPNFLGNASATPIIADGKYHIVAKYTDGKYYAMTSTFDDANWCMAATKVSVNDGVVTGEATAWTITNDGEGNVTLMSPEGVYLIREEGKANIKVGETAEKWLVAKNEANGTYTLQNTNTDVRCLSYNGTGFKAYASATDKRVIELLIIPANEDAPQPEYLLPDGQYNIIVKYTNDNYYAMTDKYAGNAYLEAELTTLSDGIITGNATAWTLTNDGKGNVTLMSPKGVYLMRENGSSNILIGEAAEKWLVTKNETNGTYTLQNKNSDSRYLAYNGTGFKAYVAANDVRVIELLIVPVG